MKTILKTFTTLTVLLSIISCQNPQEKKTEELANNYVKFVDSVANIDQEQAIENWDAIQKMNENKTAELNIEVDKLEDKTQLNAKIDSATIKYEKCQLRLMELKSKYDSENKAITMRKALFGNDYVADDLTFTWVNKNNILSVYEKFTTTVTQNKDSYSRQEWDQLKMLYEALDNRKNTVEKQGLTAADNNKIATLKFKFGPMFMVNRMGAKSEENSEAKE
ncbi:hypothetical protein WFZ85_10840 [Flavobacterium sp. j3]|uniref:Lipoprotein n=1 Tax=Flavobacterium aureirubrum TaxID=3133147 RepID=A0ABU9N8N6_9FLAO